MNLPISPRLLACSAFVTKGDRVADIGCDHGYLGVHLLQNDIASFVIASDINCQPLDSARRNAQKYGVADKMSFHLSDGLAVLPRDFDTLVCAGMGADTMIHILKNAPWLKNEQYTLILQCQSKTPTLRKYLSDNGFSITGETVLKDGRFLYTIMEVRWKQCEPLTPGQCWLSPALAVSGSPYLPAYYKQVITRLQRAINGQKESADPSMIAALTELENNPAFKELSYDNS